MHITSVETARRLKSAGLAKEAQIVDRPEELSGLVALGDCIQMLLRGLKRLDDNVNVNLLLAVLLRDVQQALAT